MWVGGMPVADTPLWQLAQLLVTPRWVNTAPPQLSVVWQASHSRSVTMCVGPLPCACTPLWQDEQQPRTLGWPHVNAGHPAEGVWELVHWPAEGMGVGGFGEAGSAGSVPLHGVHVP